MGAFCVLNGHNPCGRKGRGSMDPAHVVWFKGGSRGK